MKILVDRLLETAWKEIEKVMNEMGFIDDSDNHDRFLDGLAKELVEKELVPNGDVELYYEKEAEIEELAEKLLDMIKDEIMLTYNGTSVTDERGNYSACWYKDLKGLVNWAGTWKENSIFEAYQEFIDTYDIEVSLEEFADAYEVDLEDYIE